jgi:predicted dehydrogenase
VTTDGREFKNEADDLIMMILGFEGEVYGLMSAVPTVAPYAFGDAHCVFYGLDGYINERGYNGNESMVREGDIMPHHFGRHGELKEGHVYEDIMQLVEWIATDGEKPLCSAEHARHVIEIIESCFESAKTGSAIELTTSFDTVSIDYVNEYLSKYGGTGEQVFKMPNTLEEILIEKGIYRNK